MKAWKNENTVFRWEKVTHLPKGWQIRNCVYVLLCLTTKGDWVVGTVVLAYKYKYSLSAHYHDNWLSGRLLEDSQLLSRVIVIKKISAM